MEIETLLRLSEIPNIQGVKRSVGKRGASAEEY